MIQYLTLEDAIIQTKVFGFFIKDPGLLEGALARPRTSVFGKDAYPDLATKAASLMHSVIKNPPMIDGNKRTAWLLMVTFLRINGFWHNMNDDTAFDLTLGLAESRYNLEDAARVIQQHLEAIPFA